MLTNILEAIAGNQDLVLTWDIVVTLVIFTGSILYAFNIGPKKIILLILSIYGSLVLLFWFPFLGYITERIEGINPDMVSLIIFSFFVLVVYYAFSGSMLKIRLPKPKRGNGPVWKTALLGISLAGLVTTIVFSQSISFLLGNTSSLIEELFIKDIARFGWSLAPIVVIAISRKGK